MKPLILFGDSHCAVYRRAAINMGSTKVGGRSLGGAMRFYNDSFRYGPDGMTASNADSQAMLDAFYTVAQVADVRECGKRLVVSVGMAAAPFHGSHQWKARDFGNRAQARKAYVSDALLDVIIADAQADVIGCYEFLLQHDLVRAVVAGPRPQRRHRSVDWLGEAKVLQLVERFEAPVREYLQAKGVPILAPADTEDPDGYLREEFWGDDTAHANEAYGRRVVEMIESLEA